MIGLWLGLQQHNPIVNQGTHTHTHTHTSPLAWQSNKAGQSLTLRPVMPAYWKPKRAVVAMETVLGSGWVARVGWWWWWWWRTWRGCRITGPLTCPDSCWPLTSQDLINPRTLTASPSCNTSPFLTYLPPASSLLALPSPFLCFRINFLSSSLSPPNISSFILYIFFLFSYVSGQPPSFFLSFSIHSLSHALFFFLFIPSSFPPSIRLLCLLLPSVSSLNCHSHTVFSPVHPSCLPSHPLFLRLPILPSAFCSFPSYKWIEKNRNKLPWYMHWVVSRGKFYEHTIDDNTFFFTCSEKVVIKSISQLEHCLSLSVLSGVMWREILVHRACVGPLVVWLLCLVHHLKTFESPLELVISSECVSFNSLI